MTKIKKPKCVSCGKIIKESDMVAKSDDGKKWHYRCVMRSQAYHDEFGR